MNMDNPGFIYFGYINFRASQKHLAYIKSLENKFTGRCVQCFSQCL